MFDVYRSLHNLHHYVAIDPDDTRDNANGVRQSQNLTFLTSIADDGEPRIAFDPEQAKQRIRRDGFYAFAVTVEVREHAE